MQHSRPSVDDVEVHLLSGVQVLVGAGRGLVDALAVAGDDLFRLAEEPEELAQQHAGDTSCFGQFGHSLARYCQKCIGKPGRMGADKGLVGFAGFNQMGEQLQGVYSTLEERVAAETRSLEERNHELALLYEITAFFSEPMPLEALCEGFLERVKRALGADAGNQATRLIRLAVHQPHGETQ